MNNVLSITSKATEQIKKIMSNAPNGTDSVVIGVDTVSYTHLTLPTKRIV